MLQTIKRNVNSAALVPIIVGVAFLVYFFSINTSVLLYPHALAFRRIDADLVSYEYRDTDTGMLHFAAVVPQWSTADYRIFVVGAERQPLPLVRQDAIFTATLPSSAETLQVQYRAVRYGTAIDQRKVISVTSTGEISAAYADASGEQSIRSHAFFTPKTQAQLYAAETGDAAIANIGNTPQSLWLLKSTPNIASTLTAIVQQAAAADETPIFTLYYASRFDCNTYPDHKEQFDTEYATWVQTIADAIGTHDAIIVVEPDALAQTSCVFSLPAAQNPIARAVSILKAQPHISVYIDAGHPNWISSEVMAERLQRAGIAQTDGFSLNVSNFISTPLNIVYGISISSLVGNKHFVIDTSRNGRGATADSEWCNPLGRGLGTPSTSQTPHELVDALLWIKNPGESDGPCNGGPAEGIFWPEYAKDLYQNRQI